MAKRSFEDAIAALNKTIGSPREVSESAAQILALDFNEHVRATSGEITSRARSASYGFKEQWMLRWMLNKLHHADAASQRHASGGPGHLTDNLALSAHPWSLLLALTYALHPTSCLDILAERNVFNLLDRSMRNLLIRSLSETGPSANRPSNTISHHGEPPQKRQRRHSIADEVDHDHNDHVQTCRTLLQVTARCADLLNESFSESRGKDRRVVSTWTSSWDEKASIVSTCLCVVTNLLDRASDVATLSSDIASVLSIWSGNSSSNLRSGEAADRVYSKRCLGPSLILLDRLRRLHGDSADFDVPRREIERMIAKHVVFSIRTVFNERYAKKMNLKDGPVFYDQLENMLFNVKARLDDSENDLSHAALHRHPDLLWLLLDIAIRSLPPFDFRRRQLEQPWISALFLTLAHMTWPLLPQVTASGVIQHQVTAASMSEDGTQWASASELLVDVVLAGKIRISLPAVRYLATSFLAVNEGLSSWTLLAKIVQMDTNLLLPVTSHPFSEDLLQKVVDKIETSEVPSSTYPRIRDQIVLPVLKSFATARDLDGWVASWQPNLAEAMRQRYNSKSQVDVVPAVFVWSDDDIFAEFNRLAVLYAPPGLGRRLLSEVSEQMRTINEVVGSTADIVAKLGILTTLLEGSRPDSPNLDAAHLILAWQRVTSALTLKSDYQGQRWRLLKFLRRIVSHLDVKTFEVKGDEFLSAICQLTTLSAPEGREQVPLARGGAPVLERLEQFSLVLELALVSAKFQTILETQINRAVTELDVLSTSDCGPIDHNSDSVTRIKLVEAFVGRLLENPTIFAKYTDIIRPLVEKVLTAVTRSSLGDLAGNLPGTTNSMDALLVDDGLIDTPLLRSSISQFFVKGGGLASIREPLQRHVLDLMERSLVKQLAKTTKRRLLNASDETQMTDIASDLSLLMKSELLGAVPPARPKDCRAMSDFADQLSRRKDRWNSIASFGVQEMLVHIMERAWTQALSTHSSSDLQETLRWAEERMKAVIDSPEMSATPGLQVFISQALQAQRSMEPPALAKLGLLRRKFIEMHSRRIDTLFHDTSQPVNLLGLLCSIDAIQHVTSVDDAAELRELGSKVGKILQRAQFPSEWNESTQMQTLAHLSARRKLSSWLASSDMLTEERLMVEAVQSLELTASRHDDWTLSDLAILATHADILAQQIGPSSYATCLNTLRSRNRLPENRNTAPVMTAAIVVKIEPADILRDDQVAHELAEIVTMEDLTDITTPVALFLALQNCKSVLNVHPTVVNQSTLDTLLSSICRITSSGSDEQTTANAIGHEPGPRATDIFETICAVMGAILAKHRRRLSDRYHLLLPTLQRLLRCLFWPGQRGLGATTTLHHFARTMPMWMRESEEALPPVAAENFSRLLSSICNPTVSAARSAKSRGRNDLNDETKRARKLAGQNMQYLVMEYARCSLDGQISPSVKAGLLPGLYSALDAMDKELLKALNAAMDPSSRSIFKSMYDDYSKFGKWDKS